MNFVSQNDNIIAAVISSISENPIILFFLIGAAVLVVIKGLIPRRRKSRKPKPKADTDENNVTDPRVQMTYVSKVDFQTKRLLNKEEYPILLILEEIAREIGNGYRVMAQVSLGEVLDVNKASGTDVERDRAFRSINSKRLDFAVFDKMGFMVVAVEYQGSGHYHQNGFMRDAVKREAIRKAGVHMIEIEAKHDPVETARRIKTVLLGLMK